MRNERRLDDTTERPRDSNICAVDDRRHTRLTVSMLHANPTLTPATERKLEALDDLHTRLASAFAALDAPRRSTLRAAARATAVAASAAIEGFHVTPDEAFALVTRQISADAAQPSQLAVAGCVNAMDHVDILASDPGFRWLDRVILDLHYDACAFQHDKAPGRWRTTGVGVVDGFGRMLYRAPAAEEVPGLMDKVVDWLAGGDLDAHVVVRGAMAHLHIVSVHPFRDGNGRVSRIVQALVLARCKQLAPELMTIEQHLWKHRPAYYEQLQRLHGPRYDPRRSAADWVAFCVEAHVEQACRWLEYAREAPTDDRPPRYVGAGEGSPDLARAAEGNLDR
jgi:Fic family protein